VSELTKSKKKKVEVKDEDYDEFEIDFSEEDDEEETSLALVTNIDGIELPAAWGQAATNIDEVTRHRQSFNLKHGMFANVPMVCKGTDCPLHEVCTVPIKKRPFGQRCPIEIAAIIDRYEKYCTELGVGPEDYFDQSQVKDLVDVEVKLLRANGHLAISGNFIEQVVQAIDDNGNAHYRPELHKATEYEEKLLARKSKILADLNTTRKAKKQDNHTDDPSSFAADLMRRAMKARMASPIVIDAESSGEDEE
jgi:hypothetical protein